MTTSGSTYDGFISYSHEDAAAASRLQAGLQRFAKPWWRRRAVRVFRDDANLGANPHLWASIAEALDASGWLIVLLSPSAASSEWVNREVSHWIDHHDGHRILPVLLQGSLTWSGHDVEGDVPPALRGVFPAEPRWVDLRFATDTAQLTLPDPRFAEAIADLASTMRGVPKDELAGEEVRQHRRTVRTAWAAALALVALAISAVSFGISSTRNAEEARAQAARADATAIQALEEADRADRTARQLIEFALDWEAAGVGRPGTDFLPVFVPTQFERLEAAPESHRLDFLQEHCEGGACHRAASFVDGDRRTRLLTTPNYAGTAWLAGSPFHIRHGFPNPAGDSFGERRARGWIVNLYVTRRSGPDTGTFPEGQTQLLRANAELTELSDDCGPAGSGEPTTCNRWVFEFPQGMPEGRFDFSVEWVAPCASWFETDVCPAPNRPVSFFASAISLAFVSESYPYPTSEPVAVWPWDPWDDAETLRAP